MSSLNTCKEIAENLDSFKIGKQSIAPRLALAPMAGITHPAFRELVSSFGGCGLYFSEMLSAKRVPSERKKNPPILRRGSGTGPLFYQVMGSEPEELGKAVSLLETPDETGERKADGIDINMGCSVFGIRKSGAGSGLMMEPDRARRSVALCRKKTTLPLTVKIRLGTNEDPQFLIRFAKALQDEGVDAITLHPRLIKERFKRGARWSFVGELKKNLTVPVIGNGDIENISDIDTRVSETNCDGVMIGRLAVTKPWVFRAYVDGVEPDVDKRELFFRFIRLLSHYYDPKTSLQKLKIFSVYYSKNFLFGHHLATKIRNSKNLEEAVFVAEKFFSKTPSVLKGEKENASKPY